MNKNFALFKIAEEPTSNSGGLKHTVETAIDTAVNYGSKLAPAKLKNAVNAIKLFYLGGSAGYSASSFAETGSLVDWMDTATSIMHAGPGGPLGGAFSVGWDIGRLAGELGLDRVANNFIASIQDDSDLQHAESLGELLNRALQAKDKKSALNILDSVQKNIVNYWPIISAKPPNEKRNSAIKSLRSIQNILSKVKEKISTMPEKPVLVNTKNDATTPAEDTNISADESHGKFLEEKIQDVNARILAKQKALRSVKEHYSKKPGGPDSLR